MSFTGMDIGAVRQLAGQLNSSANEIHNVAAQLTNLLNNTPWVGPDRERFVGDWHSNHVSQLNQVVMALQDASQSATRNANEQEQAANS